MEAYLKGLVSSNINLAVPIYLLLSYGYYTLDESLVSDTYYDSLSKLLLDNYETINHRHKHLITLESLEAGTLYDLKRDSYPSIVASSYQHLKGAITKTNKVKYGT